LIAPEISAVLSLVLPLVAPVTGFAFSIAGSLAGSDGADNAIRTAATDVVGVAGGLLSPVGTVLSSLLK
jgi:hypothetical protein